MATTPKNSDSRLRLGWLNRGRIVLRFLALTGILIAAASLVWFSTLVEDFAFDEENGRRLLNTLTDASNADLHTAGSAIVVGLGLAVVWGLVELLTSLFGNSVKRSAVGVNVGIQSALAVALLIAVNMISFTTYERIDLTSKKEFTLPGEIVEKLKALRSPTTIVVLQQHQTLSQANERPDRYDYAAERKIVEKVRDLVEQFREFGPQFKVVVLDVEDADFDSKLKSATKGAKELEDAIRSAPENSIFFHAEGKVQRLSFSEFYLLDKVRSKEKENLVLLPQGVEPFAKRVLNLEERKPRVAVAVGHEILSSRSSENDDTISQAGIRRSLERYGFDVTDIVLKRWPGPQPAGFDINEALVEKQEGLIADAERTLRIAQVDIQELEQDQKSLKDVLARFGEDDRQLIRSPDGRIFSVASLREYADSIPERIRIAKSRVQEQEAELTRLRLELGKLLDNEKLLEQRREQNIKRKLSRLVQEVDLLIVPRITILNAATGSVLPSYAHDLSREQAEVVEEFLIAGKPVLVLAGPLNTPESDRRGRPIEQPTPDPLENLLADLGMTLGMQTILFDAERASFADARTGLVASSGTGEVPPLRLPEKTDARLAAGLGAVSRGLPSFDLVTRHPRPVYPPTKAWPGRSASVLLLSDAKAWNESKPFPEMRAEIGVGGNVTIVPSYVPSFQEATRSDSKFGTLDAERRGPFPVGVAWEGPIPAAWYRSEDARRDGNMLLQLANFCQQVDLGLLATGLTTEAIHNPGAKARLIVIGHGGLFSKSQLSPAREQLLLHACNWLLRRDDRLPLDSAAVGNTWEFKRIEMPKSRQTLWRWGTLVGLPVLFLYLGLIVQMIRRVR